MEPPFHLSPGNFPCLKFQNLLTRDFQKNFVNFYFEKKNSSHSLSFLKENQEKYSFCFSLPKGFSKNKNIHGNYYFSYFPIQFLPLCLSSHSLNTFSSVFKTSQTFSTLDFHPLKKKLNFCFCHKRYNIFMYNCIVLIIIIMYIECIIKIHL